MSLYSQYKNLASKEVDVKQETLDAVPVIGTAEEKQEMVSKNKVCVINVSADWCGPCKKAKPYFALLAEKYNRPGVCMFAREDSDLKLSPDVKGIPSFLIHHNGRLHAMVVGASFHAIEGKVVELLTNEDDMDDEKN
jgi:thiol-disulfide isomerase/thioredoxin